MEQAESSSPYATFTASLEAQIAGDPTASRLQDFIGNLTEEQIATIKNISWACEVSKLTQEQKDIFRRRFIEKLTSDEARNHMKFTAKTAADACKAIDTLFDTLATGLSALDDFQETYRKLVRIRQQYRTVLHQSHEYAVMIATYGERFGQIFIPLFDDPYVSRQQKIRNLDKFIARADTFKEYATSLSNQFDNINHSLVGLVGTFENYGKEAETTDVNRLMNIQKEIDDLQDSLKTVASCFLFDVTLGLLPAGTVYELAHCCLGEKFLTPLTLACGVGGGVLLGLMAYQAYQNSCINKKIEEKLAEKSHLEGSIDEIQRIRQELVDLGDTTRTKFGESIKVLASVWNFAKNDATELRDLLEQSKDDLDLPRRYLIRDIGNTAGVYLQLSVYLRSYADGISNFA